MLMSCPITFDARSQRCFVDSGISSVLVKDLADWGTFEHGIFSDSAVSFVVSSHGDVLRCRRNDRHTLLRVVVVVVACFLEFIFHVDRFHVLFFCALQDDRPLWSSLLLPRRMHAHGFFVSGHPSKRSVR